MSASVEAPASIKVFDRPARVFDRAAQGFGCLLLAALLVCVLLGVVTRALGDPLIWTDEAARLL